MGKKNLNIEFKFILHNQFKDALHIKRRDLKKDPNRNKGYKNVKNPTAVYDKLSGSKSLEHHLANADKMATWLREEKSIKGIKNISKNDVLDYFKAIQPDYMDTTLKAYQGTVNHLFADVKSWEEPLNLRDEGFFKNKQEVSRNRNYKHDIKIADVQNHYQKPLFLSQSFGLRRSELVLDKDSRKTGYPITVNSLYECENKVHCATFGKGGRYRTVEILESHKEALIKEYGDIIKQVERLPNELEFKEIYKNSEYIFETIGHNLNIQSAGRQYYANHKLEEIEKHNRQFELLKKNTLKSGYQKYTTNGRQMDRGQAQFISQMLGHNRLDVLIKYIFV